MAIVVQTPSTEWPSELPALPASSSGGCEADSAGSLMTIFACALPVDGSAPRAWRCSQVISAALSVVGTAATRDSQRRAERLRRVDDAPAAERDQQLAADRVQQVAGRVLDVAGRQLVDVRRAGHERGRRVA